MNAKVNEEKLHLFIFIFHYIIFIFIIFILSGRRGGARLVEKLDSRIGLSVSFLSGCETGKRILHGRTAGKRRLGEVLRK